VKSIDQYPIYELGAALKHFKDKAEDNESEAFPQMFATIEADRHIRRLIEGSHFEVGYCQQAAEELSESFGKIVSKYFIKDGAFNVPEEPVPSSKLSMLITDIERFEHQLSAELKKIGTYYVPERGIYNTERLVDSADKHIHKSVRDGVPHFSLQEIRRSGRCLAFGLYSASGFHAARAVESITRLYYEKYLGKPKNKNLTLGLMASHLESYKPKKLKSEQPPNEKTVRHLKDFTSLDRNPLMHRFVDLSEKDAMTLFSSATSVISEMAGEIKIDEDAKPQLEVISSDVKKG
jgi:hypothetical protein